MASFEGDVIYAPGSASDTAAAPVEILYSTAGLVQKGGTLTPGQGSLPAGTPVAVNSATKRYEKATAAADTTGFLRIGVETGDANALPKQGVIVLGGVVKASKVGADLTPGVDSSVGADLAAALGGTYNEGRDFIKF